MSRFADLLNSAIEEARLTAAEVAESAGLTESAISLLRAGRREPSYRTLQRLAHVFPSLGEQLGEREGPFDSRQYQTTHVTGGTIMGADPASSVVSPRLQHWDAENLFVVGASVYPHNSGYNPTGPLAALALRLGDDVARYVARPGKLA